MALNLSAIPTGSNVVLRWETAAGAAKYRVRRASNGAKVVNWTTTLLTYTDQNVADGSHDYEVYAVNAAGGVFERSLIVNVTTPQVNQPPVATDDSTYTTPYQTDLVVPALTGVLANDSDPDGGTLSVIDNTPPTSGSVTVSPDGSFTFTPLSGFSGASIFGYTVSDGQGGTDTATVTITVAAAPVVEFVLSGDVDDNDVDLTWTAGPTGTVKYRVRRGGKVVLKVGNVLTSGTSFHNHSPGTHAFVVEAQSTGNNVIKTSNTVPLTVPEVVVPPPPPPNQAPVAIDDADYTTPYETPLEVTAAEGLLANDSDPDENTISVTDNTQPAGGDVAVEPDGSFIYTPDDGFEGADTFEYTITDIPAAGAGAALTDTATATITVADAPPDPDPDPGPVAGTYYGAGKDTVGGFGGTVYQVANYSALKARLAQSGARIIQLQPGVVYDGGGTDGALSITNPNCTLEGPGKIVRAWLQVRASQVILRNFRIRTGDEGGIDAQVAEPISVNGGTGAGISNIMIDHVEAVFGTDGGVTFLQKVTNATVQFSIVGAGLYYSRHIEGTPGQSGHAYAMNISDISSAGTSIPTNITAYRNLIIAADGRLPRVIGALGVDVVNNVIYNFRQSPEGNPKGLNLVYNWYRSGPAAAVYGKTYVKYPWKSAKGSAHQTIYENSVYVAGNVPDGFTASPPSASFALKEDGVVHAYKGALTPEATAGLLDRVLADVGERTLGTAITGVTSTGSPDTFTKTAHGLANGAQVVFTALTGGTGLALEKLYYVVATAANTFQLALTSGGAAINATTDVSAATVVELLRDAVTEAFIDSVVTRTGSYYNGLVDGDGNPAPAPHPVLT